MIGYTRESMGLDRDTHMNVKSSRSSRAQRNLWTRESVLMRL